jgi:hypothetical protein
MSRLARVIAQPVFVAVALGTLAKVIFGTA